MNRLVLMIVVVAVAIAIAAQFTAVSETSSNRAIPAICLEERLTDHDAEGLIGPWCSPVIIDDGRREREDIEEEMEVDGDARL
ncbi:MAG: hypothetical protein ACT4P5_14280 [Armatimonadota bacterium]